MRPPKGYSPNTSRVAADSTGFPVAIGERDFLDFSHTATYFKYFGDSSPNYLKTAVWKGIVSNLKLDIIEELIKAIKGTVLFRRDRSNSRIVICKMACHKNGPQMAAEIRIQRAKSVSIYFYSTKIDYAKDHIENVIIPRLNKIIEPYTTQPEESNLVNISFCMHSMEGANIMSRQLLCPSWEEIRGNYPYNDTQIDSLFKLENPDRHGKFIFWHGSPGVGKSFLIRAAIQKWKMHVRCMYIVDPENFFNNANYMQEILLHRPEDADEDDDMYAVYDDEEYNESPEGSKFRLLIIEDGLNNLLTETRNEREGAVSRFLNLTDGILGQGLRLVFLVTSNEKINKIDDAFLRKGRCLQELEFPEFNEADAKTWLKTQDKKFWNKLPTKTQPQGIQTYSLADLYSSVTFNDFDLSKKSKETKVGFL